MPRTPTAMFQLAFAVAVVLASACRPAPHDAPPGGADAATAPLSAADQAAIRATDTAFVTAADAGDAAGLAALYLADASLMPPNAATVQGREGIQKFWGAFVDAYRISLTLTADEAEGHGDLAYSRGRYTLDLTPKAKGAAPEHDVGKFLEILRRQPDGTWRYAVDMYSSDLPVPK
jgi:uncharacterized protein (TIGR02246 family)